ncbi:MAG: hypothetical protein M1835_004766 [Candelina submexicana]|nr:MAG: hypothetical protein M1835_004766 [Candelina submexicana]
MLWSWIDLDAKRLEPYFQLSKPEGASASDSILLHYPFDFIAFVPLKAARRRQVISVMLVFWAITPLQSAIFAPDTRPHAVSTPMATSVEILPLEQQSAILDGSLLKSAYGSLWLDSRLPAFTTREYAVLPFTALDQTVTPRKDETWTFNTTLFTTELTCSPASILLKQDSAMYTFSNGKGCSVADVVPPATYANETVLEYIGYHLSDNVDWFLQNPNCTKEFSNTFLAIYATGKTQIPKSPLGAYQDLTASFCGVSYHSQAVDATVTASDFSIVSILPLAPMQQLSSSVFNSTAFEYLIGTGVGASPAHDAFSGHVVLEQLPRLAKFHLASPLTSMVGFGLGSSHASIAEYEDADKMHRSFEAAHKLLFALAMNAVMKPSKKIKDPHMALRTFPVGVVLLVSTFAIIVQIFLCVVAALALGILYINWNRPSRLTNDPASLTDIMSFIHDSPRMLRLFQGCDVADATTLERILSCERFRLSQVDNTGQQRVALESLEKRSPSAPEHSKAVVGYSRSRTKSKAVRPLETRLPVGAILILCLISSIALLGALQFRITRDTGISRIVRCDASTNVVTGLPRPANNAILRQLLLNYIPTAFATFLEPFWVLLNRILCILQPFEELRKGRAKSSTSLDVKYTSLPPQLVFFRAIHSKHYLLAMICSVAVLANLVAISLSGLFQESLVDLIKPTTFTYQLLPRFNGKPVVQNDGSPGWMKIYYSDHFYVLQTNLSDGTPLPPWTSPEYFFVPFTLDNLGIENGADTSRVVKYRATTQAFGVDVNCQQLSTPDIKNTVTDDLFSDSKPINLTATYALNSGRNVTCIDSIGTPEIGMNSEPDKAAYEVVKPVLQGNHTWKNIDEEITCAPSLIATWFRINRSQFRPSLSSTINGRTVKNQSISQMSMMCRPQLKTAPFDVTVDSGGHVLGAQQAGPFDNDKPKYFALSETNLYYQLSTLIADQGQVAILHNHTLAGDWLNSLINVMKGSNDATDPDKPVPDFAAISPVVEEIYQRLSAILIGLNTQILDAASPNDTVSGVAVINTHRVFMSRGMFFIAIILLSFNLFVACLFYILRPKSFLPRMPTTIASIIAYFTASHVLAEIDRYAETESNTSKATSDSTYGYGRFIGTDGKVHIGIEREPLVVPLSENINGEVGITITSSVHILPDSKSPVVVEGLPPSGWI